MLNFKDVILIDAFDAATKYKHNVITVDHILLALMSREECAKAHTLLWDTDHHSFVVERLKSYLQYAQCNVDDDRMHEDPIPTPSVEFMFQSYDNMLVRWRAITGEAVDDDAYVATLMMLSVMPAFTDTFLSLILEEQGMSSIRVSDDITTMIADMLSEQDWDDSDDNDDAGDEEDVSFTEVGVPMKKAKKAKTVDPIKKYCVDLVAQVIERQSSPVIGRDELINDTIQVMMRKEKCSAVLVGDAGVGKTKIATGIAYKIAHDEIEQLKGYSLYSLDMAALIAGTRYRGDLEERIKNVLNKLSEMDKCILFIDEMHTIQKSSGTDAMGMDNILKPYLSDGTIRVIGATTYDEYNKYVIADPAFSRRFMKIDVVEPTVEQTYNIVLGVLSSYEEHHKVKYDHDSLMRMIQMVDKHIKSRAFPDKAFDVLDATGARNTMRSTPKETITIDDMQEEVAVMANIPLDIIKGTASERVVNLEKHLKANVFGQDDAINALVRNQVVAQAGLRERDSVQGAYMFVGSSGTGKTELAKSFAHSLGAKLIRFDMSEYMEKHQVSKLIGSAPGYVGYSDSNGELIEAVNKNPNCVLLLDEMEKAHKDVQNIFLQVLDEGHLTGTKGVTAHFNNCVVIMTSNAGATKSQNCQVGFGSAPNSSGIDKAVRQVFTPEFINRLDAIVKFNDLDDSVMNSIVDKYLGELNSALVHKGITVELDDSAYAFMREHGVEKGMGARPMKRCFIKNIKEPLASKIIFDNLSNVVVKMSYTSGDMLDLTVM